jgi:ferredoxin-NADP reductase
VLGSSRLIGIVRFHEGGDVSGAVDALARGGVEVLEVTIDTPGALAAVGNRAARRGDTSLGRPLFLVAGGSGIGPFRSIVRPRAAAGSTVPVRLLCSARTLDEVIYRDELARSAAYDEVDVRFTLTRAWPEGWRGHRRRVDAELLADGAIPAAERPLVYVCRPTGFVEMVANGLVSLGHDTMRIRTERFGPTGG